MPPRRSVRHAEGSAVSAGDLVRDAFRWRSAQGRWPRALRMAVSTAIPVSVGSAAGDVGAGLIGTIGAFTSRYGGDRPYLNRSVQLAVIGVALAAAVALGSLTAQVWWLGVLTVSVVAVAAVWLCNALAVGQPGAYMFVLACAIGIGVSASGLSPWQVGLLVLAGAATAWVVNMAGVVAGFRRPERRAVAAAGEQVARFIEAAGTPATDESRRRAAGALQDSWRMLVTYQPVKARPDRALYRLRAANHGLHVLFAETIAVVDRHDAVPAGTAEQARRLGRLCESQKLDLDREPLVGPAAVSQLRRAIRSGSHIRHVMIRVAIAVPIAGIAASALGFGHAYWAMAAAMLVLHQGSDRIQTLQRGIERLLGTWAGLGLAAVILLIHPQGMWLAAVLAVLNFAIEILVVRNYTLAAVFITATALTLASGARRVDVGDLLIDRGIDTLIGCVVGIAVYLSLIRRQEPRRLIEAIARTLESAAVVTQNLADGDATTLRARDARRDLQLKTFAMLNAYESTANSSAQQRNSIESLWPMVFAAEQLTYGIISVCWAMQESARGRTSDAAAPLVERSTAARYTEALQELAAAMRTGSAPPAVEELPAFAAAEFAAVSACWSSALHDAGLRGFGLRATG
jgi:uncharacterized membrane protein YccC